MRHKHCPGCDRVKPVDRFHCREASRDRLAPKCKSCTNTDRRQWGRKHRVANRELYRERGRKWAAENPERTREHNRRTYAKHSEKRKRQVREYQAANPDVKSEWNRKNAAKIRGYKRAAYARLSLEEKRAMMLRQRSSPNFYGVRRKAGHAYTARKRDLASDLTAEQWQQILEGFGYRCAYCGVHQIFCGILHQEHMMPVFLGGGYTQDNIVPSCGSCNCSKRARTALEFIWLRAKEAA